MLPVNQFILGGDSMLNSNLDDIDSQIQRMELYRQKLKQLKEQSQSNQTQPLQKSIIWDQIDQEINPMTDEQKNRLFQRIVGLQSTICAYIINLGNNL